PPIFYLLFFYHDTAPTEIYTLSLTTLFRSGPMKRFIKPKKPAGTGLSMPTSLIRSSRHPLEQGYCPLYHRRRRLLVDSGTVASPDRKSTRLNSSHVKISYAVFCLKKKKTIQ